MKRARIVPFSHLNFFPSQTQRKEINCQEFDEKNELNEHVTMMMDGSRSILTLSELTSLPSGIP
jgi:hypothetical protein